MNLHFGRSLESHEIVALLTEARGRTLQLVGGLDESDLRKQHDPLMSPLIWDIGHIGHFEEVWLLENLAGGDATSEGLRGIYNPFEHPRSTREGLPLPTLADGLDYLGSVRRRVIEGLAALDLSDPNPLLRDGFVFRMVLQHEYQHNETMLQTLQLKQGAPYPARRGVRLPECPPRPGPSGMVRFPGGEVAVGTDDASVSYDNERPRHLRRIDPFWIDVSPVTNGSYLEFMEAGGYQRREWWTEAGWVWRDEADVEAPKYWSRDGTGWTTRVMDLSRPVDPSRPVCHVCYHEADAYARFAGKRLPTEFEWEAAAAWDPASGTTRTYPWGEDPPSQMLANVDAVAFDTAPVGSYPANVSPVGCHGMIGDVWEWTSSDFGGYPGYRTFPYPEYSEAFFGTEYKVLRGGSWATRPGATRNTFRNWDYPIRRQIFSGFRCARDD